jgi:prevent-host-death family protein
LLEKVSRGEEVLITRRGKPIARLVPAEQAERTDIGAAIDELLACRKEMTLAGHGWKELRDEGRR